MEVKDGHRTRKKWNWEVEIEYVPFPNERRRERSYELYAESILNAYINWLKLQEEQNKGLKISSG